MICVISSSEAAKAALDCCCASTAEVHDAGEPDAIAAAMVSFRVARRPVRRWPGARGLSTSMRGTTIKNSGGFGVPFQ